MTCKSVLFGAALLLASCGNYSNEDLEFMNAVPAHEDIAANFPPSYLSPADEAQLSAETHDVIDNFNGLLDILQGVDKIRTYPPTSRIPNGRVWGPYSMAPEHPLWLARFTVTRDPNAPERFTYWFDVEPIGAGDAGWIRFIDGTFVATGGGVRHGMGTFHIQADGVRVANFGVNPGPDGNLFREVTVMYSTAAFPISVTMMMIFSPAADLGKTFSIDYHYEQQEDGRARVEFVGTDSSSGASLSVQSRWLATGRGRADATAQNGMGQGATWSECWNDSFMSTYDEKPWDPQIHTGDAASCPDISTF
jgi:hypothetical protein